jgi:hypothetical protein
MKGDPEERAIAVGRYIAGTGATVRAAAVVFGVSKSHVMGLTTDIDVVHRKKKFKAVVDMSEPISIQVENQTDIDILTKLDLLDDEDTNKVLDFINNLLTIKKYEGIEDSPIEYVTK